MGHGDRQFEIFKRELKLFDLALWRWFAGNAPQVPPCGGGAASSTGRNRAPSTGTMRLSRICRRHW
jgi:hypothetical protein